MSAMRGRGRRGGAQPRRRTPPTVFERLEARLERHDRVSQAERIQLLGWALFGEEWNRSEPPAGGEV